VEAGRSHQCETRSASSKRSVRPKPHEVDEPPLRAGLGLRFACRQDRRAGGITKKRGRGSRQPRPAHRGSGSINPSAHRRR